MNPISDLKPLVLLGALSAAGCMLSPYDGYIVSAEDAAFPVEGYHLDPGVDLQVQAWNTSTNEFTTIANAVSSSSAFTTPAGDELYSWSAGYVSLDPEYWQPVGCEGQMARVRTRELAVTVQRGY